MAKSETRFRESVAELLKRRYGRKVYVQKHHGSEFSAGLPDSLIVANGNFWFVEFKAIQNPPLNGVVIDFSKQPTRLQMHTLERISLAGGIGHAWIMIAVETQPRKVICVSFEEADQMRSVGQVFTTAMLATSPSVHNWRDVLDDAAPLDRLFAGRL